MKYTLNKAKNKKKHKTHIRYRKKEKLSVVKPTSSTNLKFLKTVNTFQQ